MVTISDDEDNGEYCGSDDEETVPIDTRHLRFCPCSKCRDNEEIGRRGRCNWDPHFGGICVCACHIIEEACLECRGGISPTVGCEVPQAKPVRGAARGLEPGRIGEEQVVVTTP